MSIRKFDDETNQPIPDGTGIEVITMVAGARNSQHFASWDAVPFRKLVNRALAAGQLEAIVLRDMAATVVATGGTGLGGGTG